MQRKYILTLLCLTLPLTHQDGQDLKLINPNRDETINFLFPHFTPYSDMIDLVLRASEFGFPSYLRRTQIIPDSFIFNIPQEMLLSPVDTIEFSIPTYVERLIRLAKMKSKRATGDSDSIGSTKHIWLNSFRPANFQDYIRPHALRLLMYDRTSLMDEKKAARANAINGVLINTYIYSPDTTQNIPISIVTMNGWRLFFWTAISQMPNFYHTLYRQKPEDHVISVRAPSRLDELSSTFIFHLCAEMRRDKSLLVTDIPLGFCPNPCATSPCLTLPHTIGQRCHLTGQGLFINDFRCDCLPGFKWVSNTDVNGDENGELEEIRTPLSDEVGACIAIDVCGSYCNSLGTRKCDVIPGTSNAVCLCKLTHMGPTCALQRDPCIELSDKEKMPGNMACNIGQGGLCVPKLGSDFYECRCAPSWTKDSNLNFENCLILKDRCSSEVCVRGDCISSADGLSMICVCPEEAYGEWCQNLRGNWGQWSPWSLCSPSCGNRKIRHRERVRGCLYGDTCRGGRRQVQMCPENLPCPDEIGLLGMGLEGLLPLDIFHGGETRPNFELQQAYALQHRRYSLLTQVMKIIFLLLCAFAAVSTTVMFAYSVL